MSSKSPLGWTTINLFDVCRPSQWKTLSLSELSPKGYLVYGANGPIGFFDKYTHEDPTVMITCRGATCGNVHVSKPQSYINGNAMALDDLVIELCHLKYLENFLRIRGFDDVVSGSAQPQITQNSLRVVSIPLAPAAEQTRIVEKLEELLSDLDAGVAELKAAQKKLIQYRQSLLKAAVEGALTAEWRAARSLANEEAETGGQLLARILTERRSRWQVRQLAKFQAQGKTPPKDWLAKYPEPVAPDAAGLPALPLGWVWASVEQVAEVISGFAFQSGDFLQTGVAVTKIANVGYGVYASDSTQEFLSSEFLLEYSDFNVCSDDILIALTRPITNNTLKSCRYPKNSLPSLLNQRVAMIKVVFEETAEYIYAVTRTPYFREAVRGSTSETLQPNMSPNSLKSIGLPLPPLVEAAVIFKMLNVHLNEVDLQEIAITQSLKQSAAQRKNILQAAFSGQLVPQDPADEPASALLARIRAERAGRGAGFARVRGRKTVAM